MGKALSRVATYLSNLSADGYGINQLIAGAASYLVDSYFSKLDERASRGRDKPTPGDLDAHIKELWLGCEIHKAVSLNQGYPAFARNLHAWAFTRMFREFAGSTATYDIVPFLDSYEYKDYLKNSRMFRIQYEQMSIGLGKVATLPIFGTFFVRNNVSGAHLVVTIDICYNSSCCDFNVMSHPERQGDAEKFLEDLNASMRANDIYFKQCLSFLKGRIDFMPVIPTSWGEVILKERVRDQIRDNSIQIVANMSDLASIGMCPNRNVLLISPPGMAKTMMFRATSNELTGKATRIWCTGKSIYYPEHVTSLFEAARSMTPCVVFIEDMDLFGGERNMIGRDSTVLNEFLAQLDGTDSNSGIIVMASTNDVASMDEALVNRPARFSVKIEIPYPDAEDRSKMLLSFLTNYNARPDKTVSQEIWSNIVALSEGFTGDYMKELARTLIIHATAGGRNKNGAVAFNADDIVTAGEQVMKGFQIGKKVKKHIND
ncbi:MAG TPA: ATP-binding protein, partial [Methylobacter sp.]